MRSRRLIASTLLLLAGHAMAQSAPFCVITGAGQNCFYYSADACRSAARSSNGMCAPNPQYGQSRQINPYVPPISQPSQLQYCDGTVIGNYCAPDAGKRFTEAYNAAKQQKMEREEHEARMALMRAQAEAISRPEPQPRANLHVFLCARTEGLYYSHRDEGGCSYLGALPEPATPPRILP